MATQNFVDEAVIREDHRCTEPHAPAYQHYVNVKKGLERKDRRSAAGLNLSPKKAGKGGRYTWEGPDDYYEYTADDVPPAVDEKDPNYIDEAQEEADRAVAAGVVEVAKLASNDIGVVEVAKLANNGIVPVTDPDRLVDVATSAPGDELVNAAASAEETKDQKHKSAESKAAKQQ